MKNPDIPKNYTGIVHLYLSSQGLEIEAERITSSPIGSILVFIVQNGIIAAKYVEKYDDVGLLIYSFHYN